MLLSLLATLLTGVLAAPLAHAAPVTDDPAFFVLRSAPEGMIVEPVALADGEVLVLEPGGERPVVSVILPPSTGGSASMEQLSARNTWILRREGDQLTCTVRTPDGGENSMQPRRLSELHGEDIRVSVTTAEGAQAAFVIRGYRDIAVDVAGPVIDMFRGMIPLGEGDAVVCLRTTKTRPPGSVQGTAPLVESGGYLFVDGVDPEGRVAPFIVDFGAGGTVVARRMVPEGVELQDLEMLEHSAAGTRRLAYQVGGATGEVTGMLGMAVLPRLAFGDIVFEDAAVTVMEELPRIGGRDVAGILGVDLLQRADVVSFGYDGQALRFSSPAATTRDGDPPRLELPLGLVGRTIYLRGSAGDTPLHLLMDTGSSKNLFPETTAAAIGLPLDGTDTRTIHGLGGQPLEVRVASLDALSLGDERFTDVPIHVGPLPLFDPIAKGQHAALLGGPFFRQFGRIEVDFAGGRARFYD
ncbi:MAG: aspartyl protease family protein [Planctomycetota bacterium]|jgi:hypothetical protein